MTTRYQYGDTESPDYDPAHEEDMRQLRKEQLEADIGPEDLEAMAREEDERYYWPDDNNDDYWLILENE